MLTQSHSTREAWLVAAIGLARPLFAVPGGPELPPAIRISLGWPASRKALGECWSPKASGDGTFEIFVAPGRDSPQEILATVVHELAHVADACLHGHRRPWRRLAEAAGLIVGPRGQTHPGADLDVRLNDWVNTLGALPHAAITKPAGKKQSTRMVKCECPDCGYMVRTTRKWIAVAVPCCPVDGDKMTVAE